MDFLPWQELAHDRFNIKDRRPGDRIQPLNLESASITLQYLDDGRPKPVWAILAPLAQNPHSWQGRVIPRMPGAGFDLPVWHEMEQEDDLGVGKILKSEKGFLRQGWVQFEDRDDPAPIVILDFGAIISDRCNRGEFDHDRPFRSRTSPDV